jgi:hypothetical protein
MVDHITALRGKIEPYYFSAERASPLERATNEIQSFRTLFINGTSSIDVGQLPWLCSVKKE